MNWEALIAAILFCVFFGFIAVMAVFSIVEDEEGDGIVEEDETPL